MPPLAAILLPALAGGPATAPLDRYGDPLPPGAVARLGTERLSHPQVLHAVAFAPDGQAVASLSGQGVYRLWDARTGRLIPERPMERRGWMMDLLSTAMGRRVISADGKVEVSSGDRDGVIRIRDLAGGEAARTLRYPADFKYGDFVYLACPPGGKTLFSLAVILESPNRAEAHLWDLAAGKILRKWDDACTPAAVSADGKVLAFGRKGYRLQLWDMAAGKELRRLELPEPTGGRVATEVAHCAALSADGGLVAVGDLTGRVRVWEAGTGKELYRSPPLRDRVQCLAFSPDGKTLAVGAWYRILLWEAATGRDRLPALGGHAHSVRRVAFSPDGITAATQSGDALILWDPLTGRERHRWPDKTFVAFSPEGDLLLREKGSLAQCRAATGEVVRTFKVYERELAADVAKIVAVFSRDGKTMATGSRDRTVRLWSWETGKEIWRARREDKDRRFPADIGGHWPLGFTRDGKAVVAAADDAVVRLWDSASGKEVQWFRIDSSEAALSPDGQFLVAVGRHVAAPDGKSETSGADRPRVYDLAAEGEPKPAELYQKSAWAPTFSPDGRVVAVSVGAEVVLLDRASGKEVRRLTGHRDYVYGLAFSPDGRWLVSGSSDLTALVWDLR